MQYETLKHTYHIQLNAQQEAAVTASENAVLLLAVPGSGKTTVIISRLGYLIYCKGVAPEQILTVTYTVAATKDMEERFRQKFGDEMGDRLSFRTINGISHSILQYFGRLTGRYPFEIADREALSIIKEVYLEKTRQYATENDIKKIQTGITYVKNMRLGKEAIKAYKCDLECFPEIYEAYNMGLKNRRLMDYDDQMVYAHHILTQYPEVLSFFQKKYSYVCVDEAQDTSKIQHDILNLLTGKKGNLFMVGDEDQSIYGFRAAYPKALVDFEKLHENARVFLMEINYRSAGEIVAASDKLIQTNRIRHEKHMRPNRPKGGSMTRIQCGNRRKQYAHLLKVASQMEVETAVLYRNNESSLPLIDQLESQGIPYRMKGNDLTFFSHPVVNDIMDFIRLAIDPWDGEVFLRIYFKMGAGITKVAATKAVEKNNKKVTLLDAIAEMDGISVHTKKKCLSLGTHFTRMMGENGGAAVNRILYNMGYQEFMDDRGLDSRKAEILQILGESVQRIQDFIPKLESLGALVSEGRQDRRAKLVLSTIHSSKGLEYPEVYLLDMIAGIMPAMNEPTAKAEQEELAAYEEERRLYYVGMTRAQNKLHIFTFGDHDTSKFSQAVFGIIPAGASAPTPVTKTQSTGSAYARRGAVSREPLTTITPMELKRLTDVFLPGVLVEHQKYGKGVITERVQEMVKIQFQEEPDCKKINVTVAVTKKALKLLES